MTAPVPADLRVVTGEIVSLKWKDNPFSYYGEGSWKATIKVTNDDGTVYRVWGTLPAKIDDAERGDIVSFTIASVDRSDTDEAFGFYKRPSKPSIVERANPTDDTDLIDELESPDPIAESNALAVALNTTYVHYDGRDGQVIWVDETESGGQVRIRWDDETENWYRAEWADNHRILDLERQHGRLHETV